MTAGTPISRAVADRFRVTTAMAGYLIKNARTAGHLPASTTQPTQRATPPAAAPTARAAVTDVVFDLDAARAAIESSSTG